jgi:hypothetical protein
VGRLVVMKQQLCRRQVLWTLVSSLATMQPSVLWAMGRFNGVESLSTLLPCSHVYCGQ